MTEARAGFQQYARQSLRVLRASEEWDDTEYSMAITLYYAACRRPPQGRGRHSMRDRVRAEVLRLMAAQLALSLPLPEDRDGPSACPRAELSLACARVPSRLRPHANRP
jgi:hypothetical protein